MHGALLDEEFRLARYTSADRPNVFSLVEASLPPGDSAGLVRQWDWKYDGNALNPNGDPYILLLKQGERPVGMIGALPLRVSIRGRDRGAICSADLMIHPGYRGRGLSRLLIERLVKDHPVAISWQNAASRRSAAPVSSSRCRRVVFLAKPLDLPRIAIDLIQKRLPRRTGVAPPAYQPRTAAASARSHAGDTIESLTCRDERTDALWHRVHKQHSVLLSRDRASLQWRFTNRPDCSYTMLAAIRGAELMGYVVLRVVDRDGLRRGYLIDLLGDRDSPSSLDRLLDAAEVWLRREGAAVIYCLTTLPTYRRALYRRGFLPVRWWPATNFCTRMDLADPELQVARDPDAWFVSLADGDLEMSR